MDQGEAHRGDRRTRRPRRAQPDHDRADRVWARPARPTWWARTIGCSRTCAGPTTPSPTPTSAPRGPMPPSTRSQTGFDYLRGLRGRHGHRRLRLDARSAGRADRRAGGGRGPRPDPGGPGRSWAASRSWRRRWPSWRGSASPGASSGRWLSWGAPPAASPPASSTCAPEWSARTRSARLAHSFNRMTAQLRDLVQKPGAPHRPPARHQRGRPPDQLHPRPGRTAALRRPVAAADLRLPDACASCS